MDWLYTLIGLAGIGLLGVIWNLMNEKMREHKAACDKEIEKLWDQIGKDSFSGMRKVVHSVASLPERYMDLDARVDRLEGRP